EIALQVRRNAEEYREYVQDILTWEKDIKAKDRAARKAPVWGEHIPPVRSRGDIVLGDAEVHIPSPSADAADIGDGPAKPKKIKSSDYRAWDKFDVDKALQDMDEQEENRTQPPPTPAESKQVLEEQSRIEKSLIEKEMGNEFFKKGDYQRAITHYGKGMKFDPTNAVLPLNRAMALIKTQQYAEAERDCTRCLQLDSKNIKALWRRGLARRELGQLEDSKKDLEAAAVLEPTNKMIKDDLAKLYEKMRPQKSPSPTQPASAAEPKPLAIAKSSPASAARVQSASSTEPKKIPGKPVRRRLVIKEIGEPIPVTKPLQRNDEEPPRINPAPPHRPFEATPSDSAVEAALDPMSSATPPAASAISMLSAAPTATKPDDTLDPEPHTLSKSISEPRKGPLIQELMDTTAATAATTAPEIRPGGTAPSTTQPYANAGPVSKFSVPKTMFEFERDWKSVKRDDEQAYKYFKVIPTTDYSKIFKNALDSDYLARIVEILQKCYIGSEPTDSIYLVLDSLSRLPRFEMTLMFMSKKDKTGLTAVLEHLRHHSPGSAFEASDVDRLQRAYKI
ncbi:uncharacterized protein BJ171DRAFT_499061, partial [Polychytrium aggregatum]|uniref:uncharacterized protein n=1 Tax=Polychytrium aggregatum TaxID=110093 RepID=UPI0022FE2D56